MSSNFHESCLISSFLLEKQKYFILRNPSVPPLSTNSLKTHWFCPHLFFDRSKGIIQNNQNLLYYSCFNYNCFSTRIIPNYHSSALNQAASKLQEWKNITWLKPQKKKRKKDLVLCLSNCCFPLQEVSVSTLYYRRP